MRSYGNSHFQSLFSVLLTFQVVEVLDPNHPVRLATPFDQKCHSIQWKGESFASDDRIVLGEYTGELKYCGPQFQQGNEDYTFAISFRSNALLALASPTHIRNDSEEVQKTGSVIIGNRQEK